MIIKCEAFSKHGNMEVRFFADMLDFSQVHGSLQTRRRVRGKRMLRMLKKFKTCLNFLHASLNHNAHLPTH